MIYYLVVMDEFFLQYMDNIMFIWDFRVIIVFYVKVIFNLGIDDIGVEQQYYLF